MDKPAILFYVSDIMPAVSMLSDSETGIIFKAALKYAESGSIPEFTGMLGLAWAFIQPSLDRDTKRYKKAVESKAYASYCYSCKTKGIDALDREEWESIGCPTKHYELNHLEPSESIWNHTEPSESIWNPTPTPTTTPTTTPTPTPTQLNNMGKPQQNCIFSTPTVNEISEYFNEIGKVDDAQRFFEYYSQREWMVGNRKMTDWKAYVRKWETTKWKGGKTGGNQGNNSNGNADAVRGRRLNCIEL